MSGNERDSAKSQSKPNERQRTNATSKPTGPPQVYANPILNERRRRDFDPANPRERRRNHDPSKPRERRKKPDWVTRMATILSVLSWLVAISVVLVLDRAKPEKTHIFNRMFSVEVRDYWDTTILPIAFILLAISLAICIIAFLFNVLRIKRKTDKLKKSIIIIAVVNILSLAFFVMQFGLPW